jgi:hypothetical protein
MFTFLQTKATLMRSSVPNLTFPAESVPDIDDVIIVFQNNPEIAKTFKSERNPKGSGLIYRCKLCDATALTIKEIRQHALV